MKIKMRRDRKASLWDTRKPRLSDPTHKYRARDVSQRIECLLGMNEALCSILSTTLNQVCKRQRQEHQKFGSSLCSKFDTNKVH